MTTGYEPLYDDEIPERKLEGDRTEGTCTRHVRDRERTQAILCPTNQRPKTRVERTRLTLRVTVGTYVVRRTCFIHYSRFRTDNAHDYALRTTEVSRGRDLDDAVLQD